MPLLSEAASLDIRVPAGDIVLPSLETVTYSTSLWFTDSITSFSAPNLTYTGELHVESDGMETLSLPALTGFDNNLLIRGNDALHTVDLGSLVDVDGDLEIIQNTALTSVMLPAALASSGGRFLFMNNGGYCYSGPIDWSTAAPGALVDLCP
jgi:hypothetical protein